MDRTLQIALELHRAGHLDDAARAYEKVLNQAPDGSPDRVNALNLLGVLMAQKGNLDSAIECVSRAVRSDPEHVEAQYNLGTVYAAKWMMPEAADCFARAVQLNPGYADAHYNLGLALSQLGRTARAIESYQRALKLRPNFPDALNNLGLAMDRAGRQDEAVEAYRQAITLRPGFAFAHSNLGNTLREAGRLDEAMQEYRKSLSADPRHAVAYSNLLYCMYLSPNYDPKQQFQEHRVWNDRWAKPVSRLITPHQNEPDPDRVLRIGYVSPDFVDHVVARFLLPLLQNHNREQFEIYAYSNNAVTDLMTDRLRACTKVWRSIHQSTDDTAANQIREDRIDILIDLSMHSAHNRLLLFARKPAPVQATWLAYAGTTGLDTIDWRITDPCLDPAEDEGAVYSEQSMRLPRTFWCYQPWDIAPEVNSLPALGAGGVTFGCLNNFSKVTSPVITAWRSLLKLVPGSRLLVHAREGTHRQAFLDQFTADGIDPQRITFVARQRIGDYLATYHQIDVALDTYPYNGGTTTCDALWMGVPVVSLSGKTAVSRAGRSILSNLGLPELVAANTQQYIAIASNLAADLDRLAGIRSTLRERMLASPLMDAPGFARDMEEAYRVMWRQWCASRVH
jgi:predicted O-linked N-acetylglucosamine transferase (SPINDLY family)